MRSPHIKAAYGRLCLLVLATFVTLTSASSTYAAKVSRAASPLTLPELKQVVAKMDSRPGFPLVVNDLVLARINFYRTVPGRAAWFKKSLRRMAQYRPMIEAQLLRHNLPPELLVVPLVESGYKNLATSKKRHAGRPHVTSGAGLWMFISSTARAYGLHVNQENDERLDPAKATEAAVRYLAANNLRFRDWHLSLAAYNQGDGHVQRALKQASSRDAFAMIQSGHLNRYLVYIMAAVIIMENPEILP